MDLDNRLKELNELPVERGMKIKVYEEIHKRSTQRFSVWKEVVLLSAIAAISLFLMILPSINPPHQQANSQSVEAIYAYETGGENRFFARPSTLYLGVKKIDEPQLIEFFEHYQDYVQPSNGTLDAYPIDITVIRDGKEERWKLSWNGMLNYDTGQFYKANDEDFVGDIVAKTFYSSEGGASLSVFYLLAAAILTNLIPPIIYDWRKKGERNPVKYNFKVGILGFFIPIIIMGWLYFIGPLYKPLIVILVILSLFITQFLLKLHNATTFVYRVETIRHSILVLLIIMLVFTY